MLNSLPRQISAPVLKNHNSRNRSRSMTEAERTNTNQQAASTRTLPIGCSGNC